MNDFYIILTASLVAINCALMGSFLVMRKMVMIGDAISHAVLPGIFIAYYISGSTASLPILIGAAFSGILATLLIEWFTKKARLQSDAAIGVSYTLLFAIGIVLISKFGANADLDQQCVLYGEIEYVILWLKPVFGAFMLPQQTIILLAVCILLVVAVIIGYKGLFITTFDPNFALSTGIAVGFWHYFLMSGVSLTTVVSFESVGAILVIAFLSGPPAIAYLLTEDFKKMLLLACIVGIFCSATGYYAAKWLDVSIAGSISTVIGIAFTLVFIFTSVIKRKAVVIST
ncbi:metal ABC transporter permease [Bacteroidia bacterium]|jgi:manganese/zinc/iron transport system permease protein|nr:metal ABC transporter permease [Bacteroidota bacterium]MDA8929939.1 metal ABC transporter permease [Bacteroidia bacterium]MDA9110634.1 metal ABC transporter permease [Bacteroidia bacterium]